MTRTHCPYCALQCAMAVTPAAATTVTAGTASTAGRREVTIVPLDFPTNRGRLCQKGWTAGEVLAASDRLTTPLVRREGELVPTDWDTALDL
ncbi:MAG: nitrite reductase, partial [Actinomycetes bacterium]